MPTIYTVGHSTRTAEEFLALLQAFAIKLVADIRTIPRSRKNPQFEAEALKRSLGSRDIGYVHMPKLGGLRRPRKDSVNAGWENLSFRGYADYMQTDAFTSGLDELIGAAEIQQTAIMCAEAVPWRCHRSLVGDALLIRHFDVIDIFSATNTKPHKLTTWARVEGDRVTYPSGASEGESSCEPLGETSGSPSSHTKECKTKKITISQKTWCRALIRRSTKRGASKTQSTQTERSKVISR